MLRRSGDGSPVTVDGSLRYTVSTSLIMSNKLTICTMGRAFSPFPNLQKLWEDGDQARPYSGDTGNNRTVLTIFCNLL